MEAYLEPIKIALLVFPFIAFLITLPYLMFQYHKFGAVPLLRSVIVYTFILYLISAYFLVILPLPSKAAVAAMPTKVPQLIPFQFIGDIISKVDIVWNDWHSYLSVFQQPTVYTILFNLLLTFPFGVYLRYYFQKKWYQVLLYTFGLSLFFEITQLTGLYGIYPKAYRLFDVDDLLMNTAGGMLGFLSTPLLTKLLPSRQALDETSYRKGQQVSIYRRGVAFLIDVFCFSVMTTLLTILFLHVDFTIVVAITGAIYYILLPMLSKGRTIGKMIVKLQVTTTKTPSWLYIAMRQVLLYGIILPAPYWLARLTNIHGNSIFSFLGLFLFFLLLCYYLLFWIQLIKRLLGGKKNFSYEKLTKTAVTSTIIVENNSRQEN